MVNGNGSEDYRRGLVLLAILAVSGWRGATAGLYTMEQTLADFYFDDASIVHGTRTRSLGAGQRRPGEETPASLAAMVPAAQTYGKGDGLRGIMPLAAGQRIDEDLVRGRFNVFGSLPSATSHPSVKLLTTTLETMARSDQSAGDETFLTQGDRMKGTLANKYRGYGIYFSVGGLDEVVWIREMAKSIAKGGDIIEAAPAADDAQAVPRR